MTRRLTGCACSRGAYMKDNVCATRARPKKGVGIAADFGLKSKTPGVIAGGQCLN